MLRVGVAEKNGGLRVFNVYWRPQTILKIIINNNRRLVTILKNSQLFKP